MAPTEGKRRDGQGNAIAVWVSVGGKGQKQVLSRRDKVESAVSQSVAWHIARARISIWPDQKAGPNPVVARK